MDGEDGTSSARLEPWTPVEKCLFFLEMSGEPVICMRGTLEQCRKIVALSLNVDPKRVRLFRQGGKLMTEKSLENSLRCSVYVIP